MANLFTDTCVYTLLHPDTLATAASLRGPSTFVVGQRMVTAAELFEETRATGQSVAVLFGDATDCRRLIYWARLMAISLGDADTHYSVFPARPLAAIHSPQELLLASSGEPIAEGYIRPYAICQTPAFLLRMSATA